MLQDTLAEARIDSDFTAQPADFFMRAAADGEPCQIGAIKLPGQSLTFGRNAEIYGEGAPAAYLYKVVSGAVRTYRVLADGRRQIQAFHATGDVFGFELESEHTDSAEAIVDSRIVLIRRSAVAALAARDGGVASELWALTARELRRVQNHAMLLVKTARERVVSFLLEMAERGPTGEPVTLPMSRQDIADYLGLTIETVSRTLTSLESVGAIALPNSRRIVLRDRSALRRLSS
jgi:CRP/FNR family nitrogen fixation transcriptional regulator